MSMKGNFARTILCSGTTSVDFGLYSSIVGVCEEEICCAEAAEETEGAEAVDKEGCSVLAACGHSSAAEKTHATVAAKTEIARQDFIARSSGETRLVSHRAARNLRFWRSLRCRLRSIRFRASDFDEAPLLAPGQARHLARLSFGLHDEIIGQVRPDAVLGIVQAGLNGESHAGFEHGVIAERRIRFVVASPTFAVRGPMINVGSDAILHLVFVDFVRHGGAGDAGDGFFLLHQAAIAAHGPNLFHLVREWMKEHRPV